MRRLIGLAGATLLLGAAADPPGWNGLMPGQSAGQPLQAIAAAGGTVHGVASATGAGGVIVADFKRPDGLDPIASLHFESDRLRLLQLNYAGPQWSLSMSAAGCDRVFAQARQDLAPLFNDATPLTIELSGVSLVRLAHREPAFFARLVERRSVRWCDSVIAVLFDGDEGDLTAFATRAGLQLNP